MKRKMVLLWTVLHVRCAVHVGWKFGWLTLWFRNIRKEEIAVFRQICAAVLFCHKTEIALFSPFFSCEGTRLVNYLKKRVGILRRLGRMCLWILSNCNSIYLQVKEWIWSSIFRSEDLICCKRFFFTFSFLLFLFY